MMFLQQLGGLQGISAIGIVGLVWIYFARHGAVHIQKFASWIKARAQTKLSKYLADRKWQKQFPVCSKSMSTKISKLKPYGRYRHHRGKFIQLPALNAARVVADGKVRTAKENL